MSIETQAILRALCESPPLLTDLPESRLFDQAALTLPVNTPKLSLQQKLGHIYEDALALLLKASDG